MGRRRASRSGGGIHFVADSIGSLVTLGLPSTGGYTGLLDDKTSLEQKLLISREDDDGQKRKAEIRRLDLLWDRNEKLVEENQRLMRDLQSFPPSFSSAPAVEQVEEANATTLKDVLPDPLPVVLDAWDQRPSFLKFGDNVGTGDVTIHETLVNVATSAPFLYIGLTAPREKPYDRLYAGSVMAVGLASSVYHSSRGATRPFFRWCDYAAIGASSMCLSKALNPDLSNRWLLLSASLLPFQPMLVTAVHTAAMEVNFAKRSSAEPDRYQKAHRMHAASTVLGGMCFLAEEVYPDVPFVHATWHVAAALAVYTCNALLK